MSIELSLANTNADSGAATFVPAHHLLGIVQGIIASGNNARITLSGKGELAILPGRNEYHSDVQDMAEFCRTDAAHFEVVPLADSSLPFSASKPRGLKDLLWQAAFHASAGRLVEGCSRYDVAQFRHWPNLTRLPSTQNAARICALLTRHPTTLMLVHRMLGIDKDEVCQIFSAAYCAGVAKVTSHNPESEKVEAAMAEPLPAATQERGLFRSLFAKISGL